MDFDELIVAPMSFHELIGSTLLILNKLIAATISAVMSSSELIYHIFFSHLKRVEEYKLHHCPCHGNVRERSVQGDL